MKFTLTVAEATPQELVNFLNSLNAAPGQNGLTTFVSQLPNIGTMAPTGMNTPQTPNADDDDESSDQIANATGVDKDGLPWDERIHSNPAKMTGKGIWRKKRGVNDTMIAAVEAELRQRPQQPPAQQPAQQPVQQPMQQPVQQMPQQMEQFTVPASIANTQQPVQLQVPVQQPMQQPVQQPVQQMQPQQPQSMDFATFMAGLQQRLANRDANGNPLIDANYLAQKVAQLSQAFGTPLNAITDLGNYPQMINYAVQLMQTDGRW